MVRKEIDVDVQTMEDILKYNAEYTIPLYQRDYSWKHDDHVEEFWIDLKNHYEQKLRTPYYFGTFMLVNEKETDETYTVVDGQQRLTTTILLLSAFRDYFLEIGDDEQVEQLEKYLNTEEGNKQRLHVNVYNTNYFDKKLLPPGKITEKIAKIDKDDNHRTKDKLLKNAYLLLAKKIIEYKKGEENKDLEVGAIKEHFLRYFTVVLNIIIDLQKAYRIFENINNKGLHLAQSDLVKNHLMETIDVQSSELSKEERGNLIVRADEKWQEIRSIIELTKKKENEYLRWYLIAFLKTAKKEEVFETIKEYYSTKEDVQNLLEDLKRRASNLHSIVKPDRAPDEWDDDQDTIDYLNALAKLSLGAMYPVLLIAKEKLDKKEMKELIILVTKFFFRAKTVCSKNYSDIETLVGEICGKLRGPERTTVPEIRAMVLGWAQYPGDDEFKVMFKNLQLPESKANYALSELHYQMFGGRETATMRIAEKAQVEHIMPQNISNTKWQTEIDEKHGFTNDTERKVYKQDHLNKLGNLTLLNDKKNKKNSNKPFSEKKIVYGRDDLKMTKDLAEINKWDDEAIALRQDNFLPLALEIWDLKNQ